MMTGAFPEDHGIVANRYWDECAGDVVSLARGDPLATLHPYEHSSLTCRSLIDRFGEAGLRIGGVQFPHAFARAPGGAAVDAVYCLYVPAETRSVRRTGGRWILSLDLMGMNVAVELRESAGATAGGAAAWELSPLTADTWVERDEDSFAVFAFRDTKAISFALFIRGRSEDLLTLDRSTAVVAVTCGDLQAADAIGPGRLPHSERIDYRANPETDFYESPNVSWVTDEALRMLARNPDILFVRYPQVDHAQEVLFWYAQHGSPKQRRDALEQIGLVYRQVHDGIIEIMDAAGWDTPAFIFSDHGITHVDRHIRLNRLVEEAELSETFVFQGDSSCAFLYGRRALTDREHARIECCVASAPGGMWIASESELRDLRLYHPDRCGRLAMRCAPHSEFQYGAGPLTAAVRSASHGFSPELPSMHGIWVPLGGEAVAGVQPRCLTDLAAIVARQCIPEAATC